MGLCVCVCRPPELPPTFEPDAAAAAAAGNRHAAAAKAEVAS